MEEWRPVLGFEGFYEASSLGRIRSLDRSFVDSAGRQRSFKGAERRDCECFGYLFTTLRRRGAMKRSPVHRVVFEAFNGAIPSGLQINHIDGVKSNNKLENLEAVTPKENSRHRDRTGLRKKRYGDENRNTKLPDRCVKEILAEDPCVSGLSLAIKYGVSPSLISQIRTRKHRTEL